MMQQYRLNSYLFGGNAPYVEELYEAYLDNPGSVPDNWRAYFDALQNVAATDGTSAPRCGPRPGRRELSRSAPRPMPSANKASSTDLAVARKQVHVQSLIAAYRFLGNALGRARSAQARRTSEDPRARAGLLRPERVGHGHQSSAPANTYFGAETDDPAPDRAGPARDLLRLRSAPNSCTAPTRRKSAGGRSAWRSAQQAQLHGRRQRSTSSTA